MARNSRKGNNLDEALNKLYADFPSTTVKESPAPVVVDVTPTRAPDRLVQDTLLDLDPLKVVAEKKLALRNELAQKNAYYLRLMAKIDEINAALDELRKYGLTDDGSLVDAKTALMQAATEWQESPEFVTWQQLKDFTPAKRKAEVFVGDPIYQAIIANGLDVEFHGRNDYEVLGVAEVNRSGERGWMDIIEHVSRRAANEMSKCKDGKQKVEVLKRVAPELLAELGVDVSKLDKGAIGKIVDSVMDLRRARFNGRSG